MDDAGGAAPSTLASIGEFAAIDLFSAGVPAGRSVRIGIGDDAALVDSPVGGLLLTCDLLVEGRHFVMDRWDPADLGYKLLAVSVSDIAAMGGTPLHALVTMALPADTKQGWLAALGGGLAEAAREYGVGLIGGDTTGSDSVMLGMTLAGHAPDGRAVTRAGAMPGDLVCVTGTLGDSAAGLRLLLAGDRAEDERAEGLTSAHLRPRVRLFEGRAALQAGVSAMQDISDGLLVDLGHICEESGVGAEVDANAVPMSDALKTVGPGIGVDPLTAALSGGEDYELVMTVHPERLDALREAMRSLPTPLTVIGTVTKGSGVGIVGADAPAVGGWDHFGAGSRP